MKRVLLAGVAVLFLATGTAHATDPIEMPKALHGEWCWIEGGNGSDWKQQTLVRETLKQPCVGGDNGITIDKDGWGGEGSCRPDKVEQIGTNIWQINATCDSGDKDTDEDDHGIATLEIVGNRLIITSLSEG